MCFRLCAFDDIPLEDIIDIQSNALMNKREVGKYDKKYF